MSRLLLIIPVALCTVLTGCGGGSSDDAPATPTATVTQGLDLSAEAVETRITLDLLRQVGNKPDAIDCPGELAGRVGATLTCALTSTGMTYDVAVTVTAVAADRTDFTFKVASSPRPPLHP